MSRKRNIFLTSLVLTILIFSTAIMLNYSLDFLRLGSILGVMNEHEIDFEAYLAEESFSEVFRGDRCSTMSAKIESLKEEIKEVGADLSSYGRIGFFKNKDYSYLDRKYFILQLKFLALIEDLNKECNSPYIPILFFYKVDDEASERQGYILSELSDKYKDSVIILSIDKDYEHEPLINALIARHNVTTAPTIIIAGGIKYERLVYEAELSLVIRRLRENVDFYGGENDFGFVLDRANFSRQEFIGNMSIALKSTISGFAKGDISLMLGRLTKNNTLICNSIDFYKAVNTSNNEERALIYETIASIGCGNNRKGLLLNASSIWAELGNNFRADIDSSLADGREPSLQFETSPPEFTRHSLGNISLITIGKSSIKLTKGEVVVSQADRVTRDWLSRQVYSSPFSDNILTVFSERLFYNDTELLPAVGWHEGARIKELKKAGITHKVAAGTLIALLDGKWYAPDEKGVFRFEVPIDKVLYPTTRFLSREIAVIIDTHGINTIVEQAIRSNAGAVVGCCDHPGKIKAAEYLSKKGIDVICFTDKYVPLLLGTGSSVLGSPPIRVSATSAILGDRAITFSANSTIVVEDVEDYANVQSYYDTPARYFRLLEEMANLNPMYVPIEKAGGTGKVIDVAEFFNAEIIAIRIFNSDDYKEVKGWLEKDSNHKALLFHSAAYPYGYKLFEEFPEQTSFDDINPILK